VNNTSLENKDISVPKTKNPLKRAYSISSRTFVVIDDTLVKELQIEVNNTWFEQEKIQGGIALRIQRIPSSKDK